MLSGCCCGRPNSSGSSGNSFMTWRGCSFFGCVRQDVTHDTFIGTSWLRNYRQMWLSGYSALTLETSAPGLPGYYVIILYCIIFCYGILNYLYIYIYTYVLWLHHWSPSVSTGTFTSQMGNHMHSTSHFFAEASQVSLVVAKCSWAKDWGRSCCFLVAVGSHRNKQLGASLLATRSWPEDSVDHRAALWGTKRSS